MPISNESSLYCQYCNRKFKSRQSKCNHISQYHGEVHKNKKKIINSKFNINIKNNDGNIEISDNSVNNTIINNYTIDLNKFRDETYDKLTLNENRDIIKKGCMSPIPLVTYLHFNKNIPENHNVYISNLNSGYGNIFDGTKWVTKSTKEIIQDILLDKSDYLSKIIKEEKCVKNISKALINGVIRAIQFCENPDDTELKGLRKDIIDGIILALYNNRDNINVDKKKFNKKN